MLCIWWALEASSRDNLEESCAAMLFRFWWHNQNLFASLILFRPWIEFIISANYLLFTGRFTKRCLLSGSPMGPNVFSLITWQQQIIEQSSFTCNHSVLLMFVWFTQNLEITLVCLDCSRFKKIDTSSIFPRLFLPNAAQVYYCTTSFKNGVKSFLKF